MIRLAWRQFRLHAAIATGLLALVAVVVLLTRPSVVHFYETVVVPCASHHDCSTATNLFIKKDQFLQASLPDLVLVAPALIGVFWGAPLVAREIESRTFRLAWTQSISRLRWLATRLAVAGLASMVVTGLLSLMVTWWFSSFDRVNANRLSPAMFGVRGITPIGYAAFGFVLGVTLGVLVRRTLPAMALTIVGFVGARLAVAYGVRPRLAIPVEKVTPLVMPGNGGGASGTGPPGSWVLSNQTIAGNGQVIGQDGGIGQNGEMGVRVSHSGALSIPGAGSCPGVHLHHVGRTAAPGAVAHAFNTCARHLGLHEVLSYQPASRFWSFQWEETAIFLALALLLAGFCFWWLVARGRRSSGEVLGVPQVRNVRHRMGGDVAPRTVVGVHPARTSAAGPD